MTPESAAPKSERVTVLFRKHRTSLVTLVFTDIVESTQLKSTLGDQAGAAFIQQHRALVRELLRQVPGGDEIETAGDSFLLVFSKPSAAVTFALLLQHQQRESSKRSGHSVPLRVGIHLGEVVIEEHETGRKPKDLYGIQLDTCARVMSLAKANQVLLSRGVFDNARQVLKGEDIEGVGPLEWLNHGPYLLKGIEEPIEICEVREAGPAEAPSPPTSSEKAQRQVRLDEEPVLGWRPAVGQPVPNTRWVLEEKLGEGGFGEVWKARHERLSDGRVFKFCFRADRVRSLKREVTLFRLLKERIGEHPNIVRLHDICFDHPPYYLEEEYVPGRDLRNWGEAQGGINKVPLKVRLEIVAQAAEALQAAHDAGVIHRDVKPGNILVHRSSRCQQAHSSPPADQRLVNSTLTVGRGGSGHEETRTSSGAEALGENEPHVGCSEIQVKLTDFGIGQVLSEEYLAGVTRAGFTQTMMPTSSSQTGTQLYMAPELLAAKPASTRSDIYSLGVVLYQLLVGDFTRPVATDWGNDVPESLLREDLHRCLAGKPEDRFARAAQLAANLRSLPERQAAEAAQQAELAARERAAYRRGIVRTAGVAVVILAVVASLALIALDQSRRAQVQADRAERQTRIAEARAEESRQHLVQVNVGNGVRLMNEGQLFDSLPWLVEALRLEQGRPEGEDLQRWRLGAVLDQCPKLAQIWFHSNAVNCAAFSPDGRRLVTGTGRWHGLYADFMLDKRTPGRAQIWDVETGQPLGRPLGHGRSISQIRFSRDGRWIATASADGTAQVWDASTGDPRTPELRHSNSVRSVVFSRDGSLVATGSDDQTARVWEAQTGRLVVSLKHSDVVGDVEFSPDGSRLVTISDDGLRLWNTKSGANLLFRKGHDSVLLGFQWSPDGSRWVTAAGDRTARLWDAHTGEVLHTWPHEADVHTALFSPDGQRVVTASDDRSARVWDARTGAPGTSPLRHGSPLRYAEFSPDGLMIVTASLDQTARVWDALAGQPLTPPLHHGDAVWQARFSPDGHRLLTVSYDGTARLWELAVGVPSAELAHRLPVNRVALNPTEDHLLTASADGTAQVWDLNAGRPVGPPLQHLRGVSEAVFSPEGQRVLTASYDRTARVWRADTGKPVTPPMLHEEGVVHAAFSPDGRRVATASTDKTAAVWDADIGQRITPFLVHSREVQWVAFSPDGQRLVTACRDRLARVWDASSGLQRLVLNGHKDWVLRATFSPDGRQILTASADSSARLWDAPTGRLCAELRHGGAVVAASFSGDGQWVVTASGDGTARVWKADQGQAATAPLRHESGVQEAAFSRDGRWVVTASWDRTVRLWNAATGDPITPPIRLLEGVRHVRLSADGQHLVAASGSAGYVWKLPKEVRPMADTVLLAQLLTGEATDAQARAGPLDPPSVKRAWQTLRSHSTEPSRGASTTTVRAWHRQALGLARQRGEAFGARWHVDRLLELAPGDDSLRQLQASLASEQAGSTAGGAAGPDPFAEARARIPPRGTAASENLIDLSDYYTVPLTDAFLGDAVLGRPIEDNNLSSLTRGIQTLAGVAFDLRGWVQLQGAQTKGAGYRFPQGITGIKVGRRCRRLHFLHATGWTLREEGTEIARYVMHLAEGQPSERLVRYGNDVRNFWLIAGDPPEHPEAVRAWVGTNALTADKGISFRLYKSVWENPRPEVPVETIDYISTMTDCPPFLIAITAEP